MIGIDFTAIPSNAPRSLSAWFPEPQPSLRPPTASEPTGEPQANLTQILKVMEAMGPKMLFLGSGATLELPSLPHATDSTPITSLGYAFGTEMAQKECPPLWDEKPCAATLLSPCNSQQVISTNALADK